MIGKTVSHYRIVEKIGAGGMGEVYLAEDTELRRRVAIKFLPGDSAADRDVISRFKLEAQAAASLDHPNIITIYEVSEHEGRPFIVMAYVDGRPLSELIKQDTLSIDTVLGYAIQIAEGLDKAHREGVIHRDIKPDNILVDNEGTVKILDFGLAKLGDVTRLTAESSTLGTVHYMSPEQTRSSDVDQRSDLFSFGSVLYEMITGRVPFRGDHPGAIAASIVNDEPHPVERFNSQASPELQRIVSKAMAKDPSERYQSAADLAADLKRERRVSMSGISPAFTPPPTNKPPRRKVMRFIIPASVVGIALALILVFKPFTFEIAPDQPVEAEGNTLAIMYFDNKVDRNDEQRLGEIITDLLITDLSRVSSLNVLSSQRLYDLLKLEGHEGTKSLDPTTSTDVARRAGAKWMLMGSILRVAPEMVVTYQVVDVKSGAVASSERVTGASGEDVFAVADRLSGAIRKDMSVPVTSTAESGALAAKVSTKSAEAYRFYLEGIENEQRYYWADAKESFKKAVDLDSTFAMAWFHYSKRLGGGKKQKEAIERALRHAAKLSERERLWIDAQSAFVHDRDDKGDEVIEEIVQRHPEDKEAWYLLGIRHRKTNPEEAIRHFRKVIEIDPMYKLAYNQMAYAYERIGDLDQSIWAINKYIEIAPDEPNPYDSRGDLYAWHGKIDAAITSYQKALDIRPAFEASARKLVAMYRARRDYNKAEDLCRKQMNSENRRIRSQARFDLAALLAYQGKLTLAMEQFDQGIAADRLENYTDKWQYWDKLIAKGQIYEQRGEYDKAIALVEGLPRRDRGDDKNVASSAICWWAAWSGDFEQADVIAASMKALSDKSKLPEDRDEYLYCAGGIALARGQFDDAIKFYGELARKETWIWTSFPLARAYQGADRLSDAVREYEKILRRYDDSWATDPITAVLLHYYTGLAYEQSGWKDKAIERYTEFLTIWKDADPGIDPIDDAKQRLERLRAGS